MKELPKSYESQQYEDEIYKRWESSGFFNPDNLEGEPYTIMMPPPNVTGILHLGHALEHTLMDVVIRYQRMQGKKALLLPGTDHAAVATQAKVESLLVKQGMVKPREELGREGLLQKIREFSEDSKSTILSQMKKMGSSADWSRLAYTFDEPRSEAVNQVFVKMFNDGLIYRGYRVVNWSVKGQSTCSDDELEYIDRKAKMYTFKYSKDFPITIATTRPETKVGDTAVAVHPEDERYQEYIGKTFDVNFCGVDLKIKVIADEHVDRELGTGALGVTPAHSQVDFEMYESHNAAGDKIELIQVIGQDGKMTAQAGSYAGQDVLEARENIVEKLKQDGLLVSEVEIDQNVGTSDRFKDVVESLPMTQWFVAVNKEIPGRGKTLKELMKETVAKGLNGDENQKVNITPDRFEKIYYNWIDNLRDWCISRQIWWGHRIPVWYKKADKGVKISFIRHGESEGNEKNVASGHFDHKLTENGRKMVSDISSDLPKDIDVVFSSDLVRASETAEILVGDKYKTDNRLREIDLGDLTEGSREKINEFREKGYPNGETYSDVKKRVESFLSDLIDSHDGKHVLIVAHSGTRKVLDAILNGKELNNELLTSKTPREYLSYGLNNLVYSGLEAPQEEGWTQDEDTLDTWFSSGTWTFSTLGFPKETEDLKTFHPTDFMQMGYELVFFWMARMILMSTYNLNEIPFKDVYIHGLVRNEEGKKFSKSDGNTADPVEVIQKYGTDALRYSLIAGISPGNDLRFYDEKIESSRNLVNKFWNISRFMLTNIAEPNLDIAKPESKTLSDKWILAKLDNLISGVTDDLDSFRYSMAATRLTEFTKDDLADWYLEIAKVEGNKDDILNYILNSLLKLWHPFMPFVTEKIWSEIYGEEKMLMVASYPKAEACEEELDFEVLRTIITKSRALRGEYKIEAAKKVDVVLLGNSKVISENQEVFKRLVRIENLSFVESLDDKEGYASFVESGLEVYVHVAGAMDTEKEISRLEKEIEKVTPFINGLTKKLENKEFTDNAPEVVVKKEQEKLSEAQDKLEKLQNQLAQLQK